MILRIYILILFIIILAIESYIYNKLINKINLIETYQNNRIPKIIHQVWIGPKNKPNIYINTWKIDYIKAHPDWQYVLWDENMINELFTKKMPNININIIKNIYNKEKEYCGKVDIIRLLILYYYGGVYIDADCVWVNNKNLNTLLYKSRKTNMFLALEPNKTFLGNSVIGSAKNHDNLLFLLKIIEKMNHNYIKIRKQKEPFQITGPYLVNQLKKTKKNYTRFPAKYFYPIHWMGIKDKQLHKKIKLPKNSYMFQYGISTNNLTF